VISKTRGANKLCSRVNDTRQRRNEGKGGLGVKTGEGADIGSGGGSPEVSRIGKEGVSRTHREKNREMGYGFRGLIL